MFEKASRKKLRFNTNYGVLTVEDLWDLSLEDLDEVAKQLNKKVKESEEESFIKKRSSSNVALNLMFDIVKHIIEVKLKEKERKESQVAKKAKQEKLLKLMEKKQEQELEEKSMDELKAELEALESEDE